MERVGIGDLMDRLRYRPSHLQKALIDNKVPGRWEGKSGLQNVYNLIDGRVVPKDGYVFIFLSEFVGEGLNKILIRYSKRERPENVKHNGKAIDW